LTSPIRKLDLSNRHGLGRLHAEFSQHRAGFLSQRSIGGKLLHQFIEHLDRLRLVALLLMTHRQPVVRLRGDRTAGRGLGANLLVDFDRGVDVALRLLGVDALLQKDGGRVRRADGQRQNRSGEHGRCDPVREFFHGDVL
jgi:hypothetical protein